MSKEDSIVPVFWLTLEDLQVVFPQYGSLQAMRNAISLGRFPVPTFNVGNRRYADVRVVREYFDRMKQEGLDELNQEDQTSSE